MPPPVKRVAVIGAGPSGLSAVRALSQEGVFDTIRVFERRDKIGGTWILDKEPDQFSPLNKVKQPPIPEKLPAISPPEPEDLSTRTGLYSTLDSNVGALSMAFTYRPFPTDNSAQSIVRYGKDNPTRPWQVVAQYLEDLFTPYLHLLSLNTTVEKVDKVGDEWVLTLRRSGVLHGGEKRDYWWQERFDAVIAASGHYKLANIPKIDGLAETAKKYPGKFEHSKAFRSVDDYVNKKVVVVGGNISAADLVDDLHSVVQGPLILAQRGFNELLNKAWNLPNVVRKPQIKRFSAFDGGVIEFADGSILKDFDKVIFATGYKLSYAFIPGNPVTEQNRLQGFYQHIFKIGDPTLAVVGQVKAAISFRVYEYQAVAVARFLAGRSQALPGIHEQYEWERKRLEYKGPTNSFHEVKPDFAEYFNWLRDFAGPPAKEAPETYELPAWSDEWAKLGLKILELKDKYWERLGKSERKEGEIIKAKL
ncbi:putative dimethylaniline monooxygenase [Xylogone sp. PMI_703]|nr:putative dimethylaniline monooxygenase [Xylogone sp. PMI_703]